MVVPYCLAMLYSVSKSIFCVEFLRTAQRGGRLRDERGAQQDHGQTRHAPREPGAGNGSRQVASTPWSCFIGLLYFSDVSVTLPGVSRRYCRGAAVWHASRCAQVVDTVAGKVG